MEKNRDHKKVIYKKRYSFDKVKGILSSYFGANASLFFGNNRYFNIKIKLRVGPIVLTFVN